MKKNICDASHPYLEGDRSLPQCPATCGPFRCMQSENHEVSYHTTYGLKRVMNTSADSSEEKYRYEDVYYWFEL